ncbi:MAG: hypothetical protein K6B42_04805 [Clostridia bacterium]|nr:hypothetical protein [Clostridia bacterium]
MKTRQHKVLDHPILGYFLLGVFAMLISELFGNIDVVMNHYALGIEGGSTVHLGCGIFTAVGALVAVLLFKLWFRPDFKGCADKGTVDRDTPAFAGSGHALRRKHCQLGRLRNGKRLSGAVGSVCSGL